MDNSDKIRAAIDKLIAAREEKTSAQRVLQEAQNKASRCNSAVDSASTEVARVVKNVHGNSNRKIFYLGRVYQFASSGVNTLELVEDYEIADLTPRK